jgi:hypothetical protein
MTSQGSNETESGRTKQRSVGGLERLSFSFGFERSNAWAGCDGPWAIIFVLVGSFAMKMGYPVLLVPDKNTPHTNVCDEPPEERKESIPKQRKLNGRITTTPMQ